MMIVKLKDLLKEKNMTQSSLCKQSGARPSSVSDFCNNKLKWLPVNMLNAICNTLDCELHDIIEHKKD